MYEILYSRIPREKILFNKRVLTFKNVEEGDRDSRGMSGVRLTCSDGTDYDGHLVVGADGTNSAVRQGIFKHLKEQGTLPPSDDTPLPYNCVCLVGQTTPLDPELYPELLLEDCQCNTMNGNMYTVSRRNKVSFSSANNGYTKLEVNMPSPPSVWHSGSPSRQSTRRFAGWSFNT